MRTSRRAVANPFFDYTNKPRISSAFSQVSRPTQLLEGDVFAFLIPL